MVGGAEPEDDGVGRARARRAAARAASDAGIVARVQEPVAAGRRGRPGPGRRCAPARRARRPRRGPPADPRPGRGKRARWPPGSPRAARGSRVPALEPCAQPVEPGGDCVDDIVGRTAAAAGAGVRPAGQKDGTLPGDRGHPAIGSATGGADLGAPPREGVAGQGDAIPPRQDARAPTGRRRPVEAARACRPDRGAPSTAPPRRSAAAGARGRRPAARQRRTTPRRREAPRWPGTRCRPAPPPPQPARRGRRRGRQPARPGALIDLHKTRPRVRDDVAVAEVETGKHDGPKPAAAASCRALAATVP